AERRPELLRRLVLAEPAGVLGDGFIAPGTPQPSYTALIADAVGKVAQGDIEAGLSSFYDYALGQGAWARLGEARQRICRDNALTLIGQGQEGAPQPRHLPCPAFCWMAARRKRIFAVLQMVWPLPFLVCGA
ncbi:MAG: hypothetical protein EBU14_12700, partial [Acetobacteraceae bacterium]|nr:hypothetical protein [Acetobacteraceae bacterium]